MTDNPITGSADNSVTDAIRLQNAEKRYAEICNNIRALDHNSFRLLQFVPLITMAAILGLSFLNMPIFYKSPMD